MNKTISTTMKAISLTFLLLYYAELKGQCSPPMGETCEEATNFCSVDQLNGYTCTNTSSIPSGCSPLCGSGGVPHNTNWIAFVSTGGITNITLTTGSCSSNLNALQLGVYGDCNCMEDIGCASIPCISSGNSGTVYLDLIPCKTYYLWVDGCDGSICDFTLNTNGGGGIPTLSPLGFINDVSSKIIQPCAGVCEYVFFVNDQPGGCEPYYIWTLDGDELSDHDKDVSMGFADAGDFMLCVTAYLGNPYSGSVCSSKSQCATIKVRQIADKLGSRVICAEETQPDGFQWHSQKIFSSGTYSERFYQPDCCFYDSVVQFTVIDPIPVEVYYLTCDYTPFIDILGRKHYPCLDHEIITLQKSSDKYHCDSSIILTAVHVETSATFTEQCNGGKIEISPNINITNPCNAGESYQFEYRWHKKNDSRTTLGKEERLLVDGQAEDYCIEVIVKAKLDNQSIVCTQTFCELFNEEDLSPGCFLLTGRDLVCYDQIFEYTMDTTLFQKPYTYHWHIDGGFLVSDPDTSVVQVEWTFSPDDTGRVCIYYSTDCGSSCEKCIDVFIYAAYAGKDLRQKGLLSKLDAASSFTGMWRMISGPGDLTFEDKQNPKSRIRANKYGKYCIEWALMDSTCKSKDTVCVEFYNPRIVDPESPPTIFDDRNIIYEDSDFSNIEIFTPNLISTNGISYLTINNEYESQVKYHWYDIYGRMINRESINIEPLQRRVNINTPLQAGFYFLIIEVDDQSFVRKVCVIE